MTQRSSETIGAIAAALAKAQGELANPEKALTATISLAEDDLDAPDLDGGRDSASDTYPNPNGGGRGGGVLMESGAPLSNTASQTPGSPKGEARKQKAAPRPVRHVLPPQESAELRERLLAGLVVLGSAEDAALWAQKIMSAKNTLQLGDAQQLETAFDEKLASFEHGSGPDAIGQSGQGESASGRAVQRAAKLAKRAPMPAKVIRLRDKEHRKFVSQHPCVVCGRTPSEPHHLRYMQPRALGRKPSDEFTVPVCRLHHREIHRHGDERAWWDAIKIEPASIALELWRQTRPGEGMTG